jgi:replicative DNA helicase
MSKPDDLKASDRYDPLSTMEQEQWILGTLLVNNRFHDQVSGKLYEHHFTIEIHRQIFNEIERRISKGLPAHLLDVMKSFPEDEIVNPATKMTLRQYFISLSTHYSDLISVGYIYSLQEAYAIRTARNLAERVGQIGMNRVSPDIALSEFFAGVDQLRSQLLDSSGKAPSRHIGDAIDNFASQLSQRISGAVIDRRVRTGLHVLDNHLGGFGEAELIILAGRPGMGKTTLATSFIRGAALSGAPSLLFSFEMSEPQITARMLAEDIAANKGPYIEYRTMISAGLSYDVWESNWWAIEEAQQRFRQMPIELDCSPSLSTGEIAVRARRASNKFRRTLGKPLSCIVIDYLKQVAASTRYMGNRVLEVGEITGSLKKLAKELGIPVILLCQLNRQVEQRENKRPQLSDLRESGDIEQDADLVLFAFRKGYYDGSNPNKVEVIIGKNRNGPPGSVFLAIDLGRSFVCDLENDNLPLT